MKPEPGVLWTSADDRVELVVDNVTGMDSVEEKRRERRVGDSPESTLRERLDEESWRANPWLMVRLLRGLAALAMTLGVSKLRVGGAVRRRSSSASEARMESGICRSMAS